MPGRVGHSGAKAGNNRLFIEAVLWIARTGSPWRDLPPELGNWHTTYTRFSRFSRFSRWSRSGCWHVIWQQLGSPKELCALMIDSSIVRAHQPAAGAPKKRAIKPLADPKEA